MSTAITICCILICAAFVYWTRLHHNYKMDALGLKESQHLLEVRKFEAEHPTMLKKERTDAQS